MARCTFSQPPPIERAGQTTGGSFLRIFDSGHPRSPMVNHQGKTPKIDFLYLFTDRWCVARSRNHHQSKERVKLRVGLFSEFWFRSPKVTQGQLSRKNTKNRFSVPFYGQMVRCTFSQPPPIERAGSNYRWVFSPNFDSGHPRSPKVNYQGKTPKIDFLYLFTERWCVARSRNHHQSKERVKLQVGLSSEFSLRSPKVTHGQLSRENTKNRLSVPFYGEIVSCTFSQPPPIERAGQTTGGSFLRIFIKVT